MFFSSSDCGLCTSCSLRCRWLKSSFPFVFHLSLPPSAMLFLLMTSHTIIPLIHLLSSLPSSLPCAACPEILSSPITAQNCQTRCWGPCPNVLRGLHRRGVRVIRPSWSTPPHWSRGLGLSICCWGIPPHLASHVSVSPQVTREP